LNDTNKRTALIAIHLFLKLNGYDLTASVEEKYTTIIRVAASEISEAALVQWIRDNLKEIEAQLPCPDLTSTEIV
jgi:death on curing protein